MQIDIQRVQRENLRWLILLVLYNARPIGAHESMVHQVAQSQRGDVTAHEVRLELDYLHDRELIVVAKKPDGHWHAELNRHGVDVVEYSVDCDPGIARPQKYW